MNQQHEIKVLKKPREKFNGRDEVVRALDKLLEEKSSGNIQINFFGGGITNYTKKSTHIPGENKI